MMLEDTKERALPAHPTQSLEDHLVYLKHVALYRFAANYCAHRRVLDLGCGEGYGSAALARTARFTIAADHDFDAVVHARQAYGGAMLAFVVCDAQQLPFRAASFETVVSFEVIEHIPDVRAYLEGIKRVTVQTATVVISTPNRVLRLLPFQKPWNRFHLREYDARGLAQALSVVFAQVQMRGITAIPAILEIEKQRVKQNPLIAYPRMIAQVMLPRFVYDCLKRCKPPQSESLAECATAPSADFSADDFALVDRGLDDCINLIAIGQGKVTR